MTVPPALSAALTPLLGYVALAAFTLGLSCGGGAAWWLQGVRLDAARNSMAELELGNRKATAEAKEKADTATALIGGLALDLKAAQAKREIVRVDHKDKANGCDYEHWEHIAPKNARAPWAWKENRDYVFRITRNSRSYSIDGWGVDVCAPAPPVQEPPEEAPRTMPTPAP